METGRRRARGTAQDNCRKTGPDICDVKFQTLILCVLCVLPLLPFTVLSQTADSDLDAAIRSAQQWAEQNLDDDALRVLRSVDQQRVRDLFAEIEKQFQG